MKSQVLASWIDRLLAIILDLIFLSILDNYLPINTIYFDILSDTFVNESIEFIAGVEIYVFYPCYFVLFRWLYNGQTLGKKLLRIKTVKNDHSKINLFESIIDCLGYLFWPIDFLVGIFFYPYGKRMTQIFSNTIVINE